MVEMASSHILQTCFVLRLNIMATLSKNVTPLSLVFPTQNLNLMKFIPVQRQSGRLAARSPRERAPLSLFRTRWERPPVGQIRQQTSHRGQQASRPQQR